MFLHNYAKHDHENKVYVTRCRMPGCNMDIKYPEKHRTEAIERVLKLNRPPRLWLKIFDNGTGRQVALQDITGFNLDEVIQAALEQELRDRHVQLKREV